MLVFPFWESKNLTICKCVQLMWRFVNRIRRRRRRWQQDLNRCVDKIELVDFHQVLEHEGIKFWCYNAGHVLGAAMFMIEIAVSWLGGAPHREGEVQFTFVPGFL